MKDLLNSLVKDIEDNGDKIPKGYAIREPETSMKKLLKMEYTYGLNTSDIIGRDIVGVPRDALAYWRDAYETYIHFDGDESKINSQ